MPDFVYLYSSRNFGYVFRDDYYIAHQYYTDKYDFDKVVRFYVERTTQEFVRFEISEWFPYKGKSQSEIAIRLYISDKDDFHLLLSELFTVGIDSVRFSGWTDSIEIDVRKRKERARKDSEDAAILAIRESIRSLTFCESPFDRREEDAVLLLRQSFVQKVKPLVRGERKNELTEYVRFQE